MPMRDSSVNVRLIVGFGLMLVMIIAIGSFAIMRIHQVSELTDRLYDHPFTVSTEALQARIQFAKMERDIADFSRDLRPDQQEEIARRISGLDADVVNRLAVVRNRYLGPPGDVVRIDQALSEWRSYRDLILDMARNRQFKQIEISLMGTGRDYAQAVEREIDVVVQFALKRARAFEHQSRDERGDLMIHLTGLLLILSVLGGGLALSITRGIVQPLDLLRRTMLNLAEGRLDTPVPKGVGAGEVRAMADAVEVFKDAARRLNEQDWVKSRVGELSTMLQQAGTTREFAESLIGTLAPLLGAGAGLVHLRIGTGDRFSPLGFYGLREGDGVSQEIRPGEGLVGQCIRMKNPVMMSDLPPDYLQITSGLGGSVPRVLQLVPIIVKDDVVAVIELASFSPPTAVQRDLMESVVPVVALTLEVLERNISTRSLLDETRLQAEELRASQEELQLQSEEIKATNEELRSKTEDLVSQAEILRCSETELQTANELLTDKGHALEAARRESERRAAQLAEASRYKSEFLANMSHELRTPLNSLLILSRGLADNEDGNMSPDQVESARIVYESGSHLLNIINDILDLSKVEAGKMDVVPEEVRPAAIAAAIRRHFTAPATEKGLSLTVESDPALPSAFYADGGKIEQIVTNLVGNAIKFTHKGGVGIRLTRLAATSAGGGEDRLLIEVSDTGIGVPVGKLEHIFNPFEQADGTTSRQYGGTGLGLSISRRLAELMNGQIRVESVEGRGSTFTLDLPLCPLPFSLVLPPSPAPVPVSSPPAFPDDRDDLHDGDQVILVVEDDLSFSLVLCDIARKRGFKCVRVGDGIEGLGMARRLRPTGILLDIGLPGLDGWAVLEALKHDPLTRPIPVHFISATNDSARGLRMGAAGFLTKPVNRDVLNEMFDRLKHFSGESVRSVLIVDDDPGSRAATTALIQDGSVDISEAASGEAGLNLLRSRRFDCLILDLLLPDISGFDMLDRARSEALVLPPVVIHSAKELSYEETLRLRDYTDSIVIKSARSPERLLDEVTLFLHSVHAVSPADAPPREEALAGRKILVVDDDMRNAFALSKTLRNRGFSVLVAEDGAKAVAQIDLHPEIDLVLMDIMMPGMDGYAAIVEIRRRPGRETLPILALTAKAMPGDRERSLAAGANEHLAKPVDIDLLLGLIRHWLPSPEETRT